MSVETVLQNCTVEGNVIKLPAGQLEIKLYMDVAKKLELIGGKWKGGKVAGFVFEEDPTELLADIANGDTRNLKKEYQFFATPYDIAIELVNTLPITAGDKILEPSAGDGALIKALREVHGNITVDCFEIMELNRKKLAKVAGANLIGVDFLQTDIKEKYDYVIANPPFTKNQDIDHIYKMFEVLKPGGQIATIASPSWTFGSQKKQVQFRDWLDELGATKRDINAGAFKDSGTSIRCVMLLIDKRSTT